MLLAVESATELVGAAVLEDGAVRAEAAETGHRRHAETLAPLVRAVLAEAGAGVADLDAVAVDTGPGLFTGLRVGVALAKGLAYAAGIGVVAVGSLEALAAAAFAAGAAEGAAVLSVVDARRAEVFCARYAPGAGGGRPVARDEPRRYGPEALGAALGDLVAQSGGRLVLVGDGARRYAGGWDLPAGAVLGGPALASPPPRAVGLVAAAALAAGAAPQPAEAVEAVYLREADARINWDTRAGAGARG